MFSVLPEHRRRPAEVDAIVPQAAAPSVEDVIAADPSESVRSADIIPVVRRLLPGIDIRDTGGTILHPLLAGIAWNFQDPDGQALVASYIQLEEALIDSGQLPSDYCAAYWVKPANKWRALTARARALRTPAPGA